MQIMECSAALETGSHRNTVEPVVREHLRSKSLRLVLRPANSRHHHG